MRYIVKETFTDKYHAKPNATIYQILDTKTGTLSLSYYTNENRAQEIAQRKNNALHSTK